MFEPDKLIIDGSRQQVLSRSNPRGNRFYFEIRLGRKETVILLQLRLFYLVGSVAMMRDIPYWSTSDADCGFVSRQTLNLSQSVMKQYVYCTRMEVREQLQEAHSSGEIDAVEYEQLCAWPVITNEESHSDHQSLWRCSVDPSAIIIDPRVLEFPNADFKNIATEYFRRHPASIQTSQAGPQSRR